MANTQLIPYVSSTFNTGNSFMISPQTSQFTNSPLPYYDASLIPNLSTDTDYYRRYLNDVE